MSNVTPSGVLIVTQISDVYKLISNVYNLMLINLYVSNCDSSFVDAQNHYARIYGISPWRCS